MPDPRVRFTPIQSLACGLVAAVACNSVHIEQVRGMRHLHRRRCVDGLGAAGQRRRHARIRRRSRCLSGELREVRRGRGAGRGPRRRFAGPCGESRSAAGFQLGIPNCNMLGEASFGHVDAGGALGFGDVPAGSASGTRRTGSRPPWPASRARRAWSRRCARRSHESGLERERLSESGGTRCGSV